jgi:hypothetical protein
MRNHFLFLFRFLFRAALIIGTVAVYIAPHAFAQSTAASTVPGRNPMSQLGVTIIDGEAGKPQVPNYWYHVTGAQNYGDVIQLDGMDCDRCVLRARSMIYNGGQFRCADCLLITQQLTLQGPALSTLDLLKLAGIIPRSQTATFSVAESEGSAVTHDQASLEIKP